MGGIMKYFRDVVFFTVTFFVIGYVLTYLAFL